jgi:molybdopterin molybdotransferase
MQGEFKKSDLGDFPLKFPFISLPHNFLSYILQRKTKMISVKEAKNILQESCTPIKRIIELPIKEAQGFYTADKIIAPLDLPPFDQAAIDGYAVKTLNLTEWVLIGEIAAGEHAEFVLSGNEGVKVFTGSSIPHHTDAVISIRQAELKGDKIISSHKPSLGENIRTKGFHISKGKPAVEKGKRVTPAVAGLLASLGFKKIKVLDKPVVTLIITGSEIQLQNESLEKGKIFDANSFTIEAALKEKGFFINNIVNVPDEKEKLKEIVYINKKSSDVIIISGGTADGDYDFSPDILRELNTQILFKGVLQQPGGKFAAAKLDECFIFLLPGNPASNLMLVYEYIIPFLLKLNNEKLNLKDHVEIKLGEKIKKEPGTALFLKGKIINDKIFPMEGQQSFILKTLAEADGIIFLPEEKSIIKENELVEVHLIN